MPGYSPACVCLVYFSVQVPPSSCWRGPLVSCGQQPTRLVEKIPLQASCRPPPVWFQSPPADLTSCAIPSSREWPSSPYAHWDWRTGVCPVLNIVSVLLLLYRPFTMICLVVWLSGCLVVWLESVTSVPALSCLLPGCTIPISGLLTKRLLRRYPCQSRAAG